jgi:hypothetical protein
MVNNSSRAHGRLGSARFDVRIRFLQADVHPEHVERAQWARRIRVQREGWAALFTVDMTEGKVPRWAELREK